MTHSVRSTVPLALTLVVAPFAPRLASRFGRDRMLGLALTGVAAGTLIRSIPGDPALLGGAAVLGVAIAIGTVLAPAAIAAQPFHRRGLLTAVYTMALSLGPAIALGLTVPTMHATGLDWRGTLSLWSLCAVVGIILWTCHARRTARTFATLPGPERAAHSGGHRRGAATDPDVWVLALYLGVTSLTFYTTSAWLPATFVADGLDAGPAGGYTSLINLVAVPFAFLAPITMRRAWGWVLAPCAPLIAAAGLGLFLAAGSGAALPVALLLGVAQGLCLGVSYDLIVQYATSASHAASVSAVTSTVGIAIASVGPLVFGYGLENSGSYVVPVAGLAVVVLIQVAAGIRAGRRCAPSP